MNNKQNHKYSYLLTYNINFQTEIIKLDYLKEKGVNILLADSEKETIDFMKQNEVGAVLAIYESEQNNSISFLRYLMRQYPNIQRIYLSPILNEDLIQLAINKAHINYFISLPCEEETLYKIVKKALKRYSDIARPFERINELQDYVQKFRIEANTDPLTKLLNRRSYETILEGAIDLYRNRKIPFSLVLMDIDRFKNINDSYGHVAGDKVLEKIGEILNKNKRLEDSAFRYGGEEFAIVAHGDSTKKIKYFVDRILDDARNTCIEFEGKDINFTFSAGIESMNERLTKDDLVGHADAALYHAKRNGRNQICIFEPQMIMKNH